jgi:two-component system, OmpR family, sensor kinase
MRLATRLSVFFLIALALVLAGFSISLYVLARVYLVRQLTERLRLGLDTLEAAVDIEPAGLEWEPIDRQITLGVDPEVTAVRWEVRDGSGALVDRSANCRLGDFPAGWSPEHWPSDRPDATVFSKVPGWRLATRRLRLDELLLRGRGHPNDKPGYEVRYRVLILLVGLAPAPVDGALRRLVATLAVLSGLIWGGAALVGRALARRALAPVTRMARTASSMTAHDLGRRLPGPGTGDEFEDLGSAFNDLLERLQYSFIDIQESYERQRRFAGDASHQLRTPLTAVLGQVQVALRSDRSLEEYRRILNVVQVEGVRLRQIVESLLFLARPEGAAPELKDVDLAGWVADHLQTWSDHPRFADVRTDIPRGVNLDVRVHPPLLAQLLDNLLENAFKYSAHGSPVVIRLEREEDSVVACLEDEGEGLAAEDLTHIFEPFYRSDQVRRKGYAGVGLGLSIAQRIATSFGGTLAVWSEPGAGCRFILRLPDSARYPAGSP